MTSETADKADDPSTSETANKARQALSAISTPVNHRGTTPSAADPVAHGPITGEGRDVGPAGRRRGQSEGERSTDGLVSPRMPDEDRDTIAAKNGRPDDVASVTSVNDLSPDSRLGSLHATTIAKALGQLQRPDAWLTDDTMQLVQDAMYTSLARDGKLANGFYALDPLYLQIDNYKLHFPTLPRSSSISGARCLILPLHHTTPDHHWTLALLDQNRRRLDWYDPLPHQERTDKARTRLLYWARREIPGPAPFEFHIFVSMRHLTHTYL